MEWVEVTGKSLAEAKDKALDHLGVDEAQAEFEVLEEPRVGLFRRVKGEARVRARIKPTQPRPKAERRDRKRRNSRDDVRSDGRTTDGARVPEELPRESDDPGGRSRNRPAGGGRPTSRSTSPASRREPSATPNERVNREEPLNAMSEEDRNAGPADDGRQTEHAVEFLTGLVEAFGLTASVTSETVDQNYDEVRITGDDLGILIGPRAAALDSIQELARVVAQRRSGGRGESRFRVDIAGVRQRRREALERFALKLAEEVRETGKVKALEPMNAADRKVVHDIVGSLEGVSTSSEGEDPRRRVVIAPGS